MNILLIGRSGQLGWELHKAIGPLGSATAVDYPEIDLAAPGSIQDWVERSQPDLILNAAAYTAVDQAEAEPELAEAVNAAAPGLLAELARARGAILIHYSTNFVFDGQKGSPYTEEDRPHPISVYGRTKLAGEYAVQQVGGEYFIFRTSWLYSTRKDCFLTKVLRWARTQEILRIVSDQIGSPTWARSLAAATVSAVELMLAKGKPWREAQAGIYHTAGIGAVSRYEWAKRILDLDPRPEEQIVKELRQARSSDFRTAAQRPPDASLDCARFQETFNAFYDPWSEDLERALKGSAAGPGKGGPVLSPSG